MLCLNMLIGSAGICGCQAASDGGRGVARGRAVLEAETGARRGMNTDGRRPSRPPKLIEARRRAKRRAQAEERDPGGGNGRQGEDGRTRTVMKQPSNKPCCKTATARSRCSGSSVQGVAPRVGNRAAAEIAKALEMRLATERTLSSSAPPAACHCGRRFAVIQCRGRATRRSKGQLELLGLRLSSTFEHCRPTWRSCRPWSALIDELEMADKFVEMATHN